MPFFTNIRDVKLFYQIISDEKPAPTLIFVHGYGSSFSLFSEQIKVLKTYFKIVLFDAEGHGRSERGDDVIQERMTENMLNDLEMLLDQLVIKEDVGIIGHSLLGCAVAQRFTIKYPERVKFLILLNGGTLILDSSIRNIFWNLLPQFTRMNFHEISQSASSVMIDRTLQFIRAALLENNRSGSNGFVQMNAIEIDEKIYQDLNDMLENELDPSGISCPTLIIGAELDNFAPAYMSKGLRKKIPNSELHIVTMAGHFGMSQRAPEYNKKILDFLTKNHFINR